MAGGLFEVELEAMPAEAAEFEVARRYVNLAASAARNAALARPRQAMSPQTVARAAVASAARASRAGRIPHHDADARRPGRRAPPDGRWRPSAGHGPAGTHIAATLPHGR